MNILDDAYQIACHRGSNGTVSPEDVEVVLHFRNHHENLIIK